MGIEIFRSSLFVEDPGEAMGLSEHAAIHHQHAIEYANRMGSKDPEVPLDQAGMGGRLPCGAPGCFGDLLKIT